MRRKQDDPTSTIWLIFALGQALGETTSPNCSDARRKEIGEMFETLIAKWRSERGVA